MLVIPVDKTVQFIEHSEDVIHSFWVPEFLFKRDVIPYGTTSTSAGQPVRVHRDARPGSYVGRCAELCGTYHSQMNFEVRVVDRQTLRQLPDALAAIASDDPARQAKALACDRPGAVRDDHAPVQHRPHARGATYDGQLGELT